MNWAKNSTLIPLSRFTQARLLVTTIVTGMVSETVVTMYTPISRSLYSLMVGLMLLLPARGMAQADPELPKSSFMHRLGDSLRVDFTTPIAPKPLKWKAIVIPAGLIAYGTISVTTHLFDDVNLLGRRWASGNEDPNRKTSIDDYTEYVPAVAVYGLDIAGVRGKHNVVDQTFLYGISLGLAHIITVPTKRWTAKQRPDSSDLLSFPSGHTSTAFVAAEFLRQEYKGVSPWIGAGGYAVAVLTGYLRMYNNKHWFSDVLAGAGIGILSTRATYWIYPKVKNAILGKQAPLTTIILPTYESGAPGICMVHFFR